MPDKLIYLILKDFLPCLVTPREGCISLTMHILRVPLACPWQLQGTDSSDTNIRKEEELVQPLGYITLRLLEGFVGPSAKNPEQLQGLSCQVNKSAFIAFHKRIFFPISLYLNPMEIQRGNTSGAFCFHLV